MKNVEWLKPALYGAAAGAVAVAIIGFSWGGWMTAGQAEKMASKQADVAVVAALLPICLEQSRTDPKLTSTLAVLKDTSSYKRDDVLIQAGWATMPGASDPNRQVAVACAEKLAEQF
jgi:hypothetical protein